MYGYFTSSGYEEELREKYTLMDMKYHDHVSKEMGESKEAIKLIRFCFFFF